MEMNKKGFTLVELIVSFAVLMILLGGVVALLPTFFNQYNHVQNTARTQSIGTTLLEMLEGQLGYATSTINIITTKSDDYDIIEFDDKDGNEVKLSVLTDGFKEYLDTGENYVIDESNNKLDNDLFIFHYSETKSVENVDKTLRDAVNWGYNTDFYMNNIVKEFHVEPAGSEYRKNVLRISFILMNSRNGMESKFVRLIECSNFKNTYNNGITVDGNDSSQNPDDNTYPGTDIILQRSPWPTKEDYNNVNTNKLDVLASGIFRHTDGKYYVIIKTIKDLVVGQAQQGPGEWADRKEYVVTITGKIVNFSENEVSKNNLTCGDLCFSNGDYYVFKEVDSIGKNPIIDSSQWYKLPK